MQKSTRKLNTNKLGHRIAFFETEIEVYFVSCRKSPKTFNILPRSTSFASSSPILNTVNRFFVGQMKLTYTRVLSVPLSRQVAAARLVVSTLSFASPALARFHFSAVGLLSIPGHW